MASRPIILNFREKQRTQNHPQYLSGLSRALFPTTILYFPIAHNTLCLPPQILHKPLFLNAPGSIAFSQEHFKTISYAKFGGKQSALWAIGK